MSAPPPWDDATNQLNARAKAQFLLAMERYATDLLNEASRLEATSNSTKGSPEITSSMVNDADLLLRRGYRARPKTKILLTAQMAATVGGFVVGLLADGELLKEPLTMVAFVLLLTITITASVIAVVKD